MARSAGQQPLLCEEGQLRIGGQGMLYLSSLSLLCSIGFALVGTLLEVGDS